MDIKQAYRNIPVHPDDILVNAMKRFRQCFTVRVRSAPLLFQQWQRHCYGLCIQRGAQSYFTTWMISLTVGAPRSEECTCNIATMTDAGTELGMPIEFDKSEGPTTFPIFLGIELVTVALELCLSLLKLESTLAARYVQKELLSIIWSAIPCLQGSKSRTNIFMLHDFDLSMATKRLDHRLRLNLSA